MGKQTYPRFDVALTRPCPRSGCQGTLVPDQRSLHLDADGTAAVTTSCSADCGMHSQATFSWEGDP